MILATNLAILAVLSFALRLLGLLVFAAVFVVFWFSRRREFRAEERITRLKSAPL